MALGFRSTLCRSTLYSTTILHQTYSAATALAVLRQAVCPTASTCFQEKQSLLNAQASFTCRAALAEGHAPQLPSAIESRADAVLKYWLGDSYLSDPPDHIDPKKQKIWFAGGPNIDQEIRSKFDADVEAAAAGQLSSWREGYNALALIILGDQFPRNVYRATPQMFSLDSEALALAKQLIGSEGQDSIYLAHRMWLYMPFMHSEDLQDQEAGIQHFAGLLAKAQALPGGGGPLAAVAKDNGKYARLHRDVILKWGRFPHRNSILGRESTPEEAQGMADGTIASF